MKYRKSDNFFLQMAVSWGLKRLLASPATDLLVCIFFRPPQMLYLWTARSNQNRWEIEAIEGRFAGLGRLASSCYGFSGSADLPRRFSPLRSALHPPTFHCPAHRSPFIPINSTALWLVIIWIMFRHALKYWRLELHRSARPRRSTRTFPPPNLSRSRGLPPDFYPPDFLPPDHLVSYQFMFCPGAHPAGDPQWESEDCQRPGLPAKHISFNRNLNWVGKYLDAANVPTI